MFMHATVTTIVTICNNYISLKNDKSLYKACSLVVDMCAGQMTWPKIPQSTINIIIPNCVCVSVCLSICAGFF